MTQILTGLLHDPVKENITSILQVNDDTISSEDYTEPMRITRSFHMTVQMLAHVMAVMEKHCQMGPESNTENKSDLKMLLTNITNLPTRNKQDEILALDLDGTNFRTLLVKLYRRTESEVIYEAHIVPDSAKIFANDLFEFIVDVLQTFMLRNKLDLNQRYLLGFTFSLVVNKRK